MEEAQLQKQQVRENFRASWRQLINYLETSAISNKFLFSTAIFHILFP